MLGGWSICRTVRHRSPTRSPGAVLVRTTILKVFANYDDKDKFGDIANSIMPRNVRPWAPPSFLVLRPTGFPSVTGSTSATPDCQNSLMIQLAPACGSNIQGQVGRTQGGMSKGQIGPLAYPSGVPHTARAIVRHGAWAFPPFPQTKNIQGQGAVDTRLKSGVTKDDQGQYQEGAYGIYEGHVRCPDQADLRRCPSQVSCHLSLFTMKSMSHGRCKRSTH